jgi:tensin
MNLWSSVQSSAAQQLNAAAQASKEAIENTKNVVEHSRTNIERHFLLAQNHLNAGAASRRKGVFYKRDPKLPLDVDALRDANVVYITDRIITMGHPATDSTVDPQNITAERKLAAVGHLLNRRHDGRFLVWNLSEVEYDNSILDDQVLTFSFPGSPSPPLGLLLKLLVAMENWMKADERNVAVIHCLTGKGRTSMVTASFLCWMGEAGECTVHATFVLLSAFRLLQDALV